ncbi:MAG: hypothetical protein RLZZ252_629 [Bacteroidota bacterium]|jgi:arginase
MEEEIVSEFVLIKNSSKLQLINLENMKANRTCVITSDWEMGAGKIGTSQGPLRIKSLLNTSRIGEQIIDTLEIQSPAIANYSSSDITNLGLSDTFNPAKNIKELIEHTKKLSSTIEDCVVNGYNTLVFSGDHSNAIGTVSGLCKSLGGENIGVIWIDAHLDLHSPFTTPSGNIHGMSVNALLGDDNIEMRIRELTDFEQQDWLSLKSLKINKPNNCISAKNLIFIGTRSYEEQEWELIRKHSILVITIDEINKLGRDWLVDTINRHLEHCMYRYVSFDVDSLDSSISSATGTPEPNGLDLETASYLFERLWNHPQTVCMEITEFNPTLPHPEKLDEALLTCFQSAII